MTKATLFSPPPHGKPASQPIEGQAVRYLRGIHCSGLKVLHCISTRTIKFKVSRMRHLPCMPRCIASWREDETRVLSPGSFSTRYIFQRVFSSSVHGTLATARPDSCGEEVIFRLMKSGGIQRRSRLRLRGPCVFGVSFSSSITM